MARGTRRDRKKEEFWRGRLRAQAESGLLGRAWCRRHGQREAAFYWWRTQLARRDAAAAPLVPVRVVADTAHAATGRIEIVLPDERRVHVVGQVERQMLADVLTVLADRGPATGALEC